MPADRGSYTILLVEDDPDDVFFIRQAFSKAGMPDALRVAGDGEEAVKLLLGQPPYEDPVRFPSPALVLLDLKIPRKSGLEVLEWRRTRPEIGRIPVVVLTSSLSNEDIVRAYDLGANSYLIKPLDVEHQLEMVKTIRLYWIVMNKRPGAP